MEWYGDHSSFLLYCDQVFMRRARYSASSRAAGEMVLDASLMDAFALLMASAVSAVIGNPSGVEFVFWMASGLASVVYKII
jgi:hypothetical protein